MFFVILFSSCGNKREVQGYWRLDFDEAIENPFFPYELCFLQDSLIIVDGYNFKQTSIFRKTNDSIYIIFKNGFEKKYSFSIKSDSTIQFADREFFRTSKDYFSTTQSSELLGWKSTEVFRPEINSSNFQLIKDGALTKVILNDMTANLNVLPEFLSWGHGFPTIIYLYIGKGFEFGDLIETYCWIKYRGFKKVKLVTSNTSFEEFSSIKDNVDIDDSIFSKFLASNNLPPLPPYPKSSEDLKNIRDVYVNSGSELDLQLFSDTLIYRFNISDQLNIVEYLQLTEHLNGSEKKNFIIKRLKTN